MDFLKAVLSIFFVIIAFAIFSDVLDGKIKSGWALLFLLLALCVFVIG